MITYAVFGRRLLATEKKEKEKRKGKCEVSQPLNKNEQERLSEPSKLFIKCTKKMNKCKNTAPQRARPT